MRREREEGGNITASLNFKKDLGITTEEGEISKERMLAR